MENYIVSARKYRPSTFDSVVGQRALTQTLKNAIAQGKLAHAYLFCGPRGVGKTTCARIFAKTINCLNPTAEGEACNECESCRAFNEQRSYNIHELDAASNNSVDEIRQLVEQVRIPPQIGKYKVYIIDEVHMLSTAAFNAFLKTLEEPPMHAIFILATTEKHKILPTILSRCQIYDFSRMGVEDTVAHLTHVAQMEGISAEPEALNVIAMKADGGMRDALSIFDQVVSFSGGNVTYKSVIENLNVLDYEYYFRLTDMFLEHDVRQSLLLLNEVLTRGFDGSHFITGLASHLRDVLVSKDEATLPLLQVGASIRAKYAEQARKCTLPFLYKAIKLCNDCDLNYRASKNKRLLVELTLIQVAQLSAEGEDAIGGHGPKNRLKPIFTQPSAQAQAVAPAASQQTVTAQSQPSAAPSPSVTATPQVQPRTPQPKAQGTPPIHQPSQELLELIKKTGDTRKKAVSLESLSFSIRQPLQAAQTGNPTQQTDMVAMEPSAQAPQTPAMDRPLTEREINYYWQEFAGQLPKDRVALAKRMQTIHLTLLDDVNFEAVVENELAEKEFTALLPTLNPYLRGRLQNSKATLHVRMSKEREVVRAYTKVEKYHEMVQQNNALAHLRELLGLELY